MSKPYNEATLSDQLDSDLNWRRKELSDLKLAIKSADTLARPVLLRALVTIAYAHWEGYVRTCANKYFQYITIRKKTFKDLEIQLYKNSFLNRLEALFQSKASIESRCELIKEILQSENQRFSFINPSLIDTKSNLNTDVVRDICMICGIDYTPFEDKRSFIDIFILKRRNAIAHGQSEIISDLDVDTIIDDMLGLMRTFKDQIENKVYTKSYLRSAA